MRCAHIVDGVVVNFIEADPDAWSRDDGIVVPHGGDAAIGWSWDGTRFSPPPDLRTLEEARAEKLAALAARRYAVEIAGTVLDGRRIRTDRETRGAMIEALACAAIVGDAWATRWKGDDGAFVTIDGAFLERAVAAAGAHRSACFAREDALTIEILAAPDRAALDAIDIDAGWPA